MLRIREVRKGAGITMKDLGDIVGVSESTISLYETGKREAPYTTMSKIADYFGVSIDYLLGRNDNDVSGEQKDAAEIDDATLDAELITMLTRLDPSEIQRVTDFVSGILASRRV